jgi:hypothetical protein
MYNVLCTSITQIVQQNKQLIHRLYNDDDNNHSVSLMLLYQDESEITHTVCPFKNILITIL